MEAIKLLADGALGILVQWVMFGPKKIPQWAAWGVLGGGAVALWIWMTPDAGKQFSDNWRMAALSVVSFIVNAKGWGSTFKAFGLAPATDSK